MSPGTGANVLRHELRMLLRNTDVWLRFGLFYAVSAAAIWFNIERQRSPHVAALVTGLMVLAAVGIPMTLAAESFVHEKERRTMESLLLIPTRARELASIKTTFVVAVALLGVAAAFLTGPMLIILAGEPAALPWTVNRATALTALMVCPPAAICVAAMGTLVSAQSRAASTAKAAVALIGMTAFLPTTAMAYLVSTAFLETTGMLGVAWWIVAIAIRHTALARTRPDTMIRTRGR